MATVPSPSVCSNSRAIGSVEIKSPPWQIGMGEGGGRDIAMGCSSVGWGKEITPSTSWINQRAAGDPIAATAANAMIEPSVITRSETHYHQRKINSLRECLLDVVRIANADLRPSCEYEDCIPPSYSETIADSPPSYDESCTEFVVPQLHTIEALAADLRPYDSPFDLPYSFPLPKISLNLKDISTVRKAANKKSKKAQKAADQAKWADSGDEDGNKDGGEGGEENGNAGGNNGDGGAGDDGGGGDDWNSWDTGKKKKGKKAKEEEKKKEEEEEEKKKKEDESGGANPLSWADEDPGEDWGGFTTTTSKKDKKDKKKKGDTASDKANTSSAFDEINLNEDAPKIDLSFGGTETKDSGFGAFGSGGWGGGWNAGSKWDFSGADTGTTDIADSFSKTKDTSNDTADTSAWSFGGNKKNKKKTTTSGFDFGDLGTLDEPKDDEKQDETKADGIDDWGAFGTKKDKKSKKKSALEDSTPDVDIDTIGTALEEPAAEDSWGTWGAASGKKGKKGKKDDKKDDDTLGAASPPAAAAAAAADPIDDWGSFGVKDKKKKGKKLAEEDEPVVAAVAEPEATEDIGGWGSFGKKDKKKGKKDAEKEKEPTPEPEVKADDGWGAFGVASKKDKDKDKDKKKKKSIWDIEPDKEEPNPEVDPEPEAEPDTSFGWGGFASKKEKDKKKAKSSAADDVPVVSPEPEAEEAASIWGTSSAKKDKKGKKGLISEVKDEVETGADAKADAASAADAVDDWTSSWGTDKKKDKKSKRNSLASSKGDDPSPAPEVPEVPDIPDAADTWGFSSTKKDKKSKKGKAAEQEIAHEPEPEPEPVIEDDWAAGLTPKEKRKKEKEREKEKKQKEIEEKAEQERIEKEEQEKKDAEDKIKEEKAAAKDKKAGKKSKTASPEVTKTKDLLEDSVPDVPAAADDWGSSWGLGSKDKKKKGKKDATPEPPPPAPTPPAQGLTPEPDELTADGWGDFAPTKSKKGKKDDKMEDKKDDKKEDKKDTKIKDNKNEPIEDDWAAGLTPKERRKREKEREKEQKEQMEKEAEEAAKTPAKDEAKLKKDKDGAKKGDSPKEESAAKAAKSFWGGIGGTTSTLKTKTKDDEKAKKDAKLDSINAVAEDKNSKKTSKDKTESKLTKTSSKDKDENADSKAAKTTSKDDKIGKSEAKKKSADDAVDIQATAKTSEKDSSSKVKKSKEKDKDHDLASKEADFAADVTGGGDESGFGFWGSTKKTTGKKIDETKETKQEIASKESSNQKNSLKKGSSKDLEDSSKADKGTTSPPKSSKDRVSMSTSKASGGSSKSVLEKVKEINEKNKTKEKEKESEKSLPVAEPTPISKSSKKEREKDRDREKDKHADLADSKNPAKIKDTSVVDKKKKSSKSAVPGGFPDDGMDDILDSPPAEKNSSKRDVAKDDKTVKDIKKPSKDISSKSKSLPTPPPEPKEEKPAKKERPRIAKADAGSSWGLFGSTSKKETKKTTSSRSKDDADVVPSQKDKKAAASGLSRSKSTRTAKEKDKENAASDEKTSDSDKVKKTDSRPSKSRGSSFGGIFGGPPPVSRTKSVRRNSTATSGPKSSSRRQSIDLGDSGMSSPPAKGTPEMSSKAAKLMGASGKDKLNGKTSTKAKSKAVPDPYPIDSDDMVMVNGIENPIINAPIKKSSKSKTGKNAAPLRDDLPDRTRSKRDSTAKAQKTVNDLDDDIVMVDANPLSDGVEVADGPGDTSFVTKPKGLQRTNTTPKRPEAKGLGSFFGSFRKSRKDVEDEDTAPKKRAVTSGDDSAKRPRHEDKSRTRRSERADRAAEGFVYNAEPAESPEDVARAERRAKRVEKDRAAKEALDAELKAADDRRAKRREAERAKRAARDQEEKDARRAAREERHRKEEEAKANRELEDEVLASAKPRSKRRETEQPYSGKAKSSKTADRRRSHMDRPSTSRRKSGMPVDDYFDPRNGSNAKSKGVDNDPYAGLGNDHTSSWVKSQLTDPAPPPPVEGTVLEDPPMRGGFPGTTAGEADDILADEDIRRKHRKNKRSSRMYADPIANDQDRRGGVGNYGYSGGDASPEDEAATAAGLGGRYGSGAAKRRSDLGGIKLGSGQKTYDGRTGQGKRSSWLGKVKGAFDGL